MSEALEREKANDVVKKEFLEKLLKYDPETGVFTWRVSPARNVKAGRVAGGLVEGYRKIGIDGKSYAAHRLAFVLMGEEPPLFVDHLNGVRSDNRWKNLAPSNPMENGMNRRLNANNSSGCTGVYWVESREVWHSQIKVNTKTIHLAFTGDLFEAVCARKSAERKHGFSLRHGSK